MRKFMFSMVGLAIVLGGTHSASAQYDRWNPYLEIEGRAGDGPERAQGRLFAPIFQDNSSMLFGDIRMLYTDQQAYEGNFGLGYRQIVSNRRLWGAYGFFDIKETALNNTFYQGSVGAELLDINWGLRANGYLPNLNAEYAPGGNAFLQGGQIFVQGNRERAYYGMDVEAEHILWRSRKAKANLQAGDFELWAAGGYFYFDSDAANFQEIAGPRARVEARLYDLPMLGNDSRLVAGAQYEYDDVRGSVSQGFLNVRIPFGPGGCKGCRPKMNLLDRRMVTPIVRDIDIVTNVAQDGLIESAKNKFLGTELNNVVTLNAADDDIQAIIQGGDDNQVFILDGSTGAEMLGSAITLNDGQILIGGGGSMTVVGCETGLEAVFTAEGAPFTFDQMNAGANVLNITDNNGIFGLTTLGGNNSIGGINAGNFEISDNTLMGAGANAIGFLPVGGTINGSITSNMFVGTVGDGIGVLSIGNSDVDLMIASNSFDMIGGNGIGITAAAGTANITTIIDDNTFNDVGDDAVSLGSPAGLLGIGATPVFDATITNNRIIGGGATENGIDILLRNSSELSLVVDNNLFEGVNQDAVSIGIPTGLDGNGASPIIDAMITNNQIIGNLMTERGVDIFTGADTDLTLVVDNNLIEGVNDKAIKIESDTVGGIIDLGFFQIPVFTDSDATHNVMITNNMILGQNITEDGIDIDMNDNAMFVGLIDNNLIQDVNDDGIDIDFDSDSVFTPTITNNMISRIGDAGITVSVDGDATVDGIISSNTVSVAGSDGFRFFNNTIDDVTLAIDGNNFSMITGNGIFLESDNDNLIINGTVDNQISADLNDFDSIGDIMGTLLINGVDVLAP